MNTKHIAILYHGGCPDGFGGAYAAWKRFGDEAEYIPVRHGEPLPGGLEGRELYFIDFCYPKEIMEQVRTIASSFVVLEHHLGMKEVVESMPQFVFDATRSGATIAWGYFHPDTSVPTLLKYVQDGDLFVFTLPDSRAILSFVYAQQFEFEEWDRLMIELETIETRNQIIEKGKVYAEYFAILVAQIAKRATLVSFEGYACYIASAASMFASDVGNALAREKPPIAMVVNIHGDVLNVSLRSTPEVDVSIIAQKYGGNGHPQASAFRLKWGDPLPWKVLPKES